MEASTLSGSPYFVLQLLAVPHFACKFVAPCVLICLSDHSLLYQVSFLAAVLGPEIAATSAQRALEVLLDDEDAPSESEEATTTGSLPKVSGILD